jgi:hypothetical protein
MNKVRQAWQMARRELRRRVAMEALKPDRRSERGLRYWLDWQGILNMPSPWLQRWKLEGHIPWVWLGWALMDYLKTKAKPLRKRQEDIAATSEVTTEIVRRDIKHFKTRANSIRLHGTISLAILLRHVEQNSPSPPRIRAKR